MHAERLWLAALLWSLVGGGLYALRRRSPLHLPTLALFATGLVGSFFPLVTLFIEPASWRNLDALSPEVVAATQVEFAAFAAGLLLAVLITARAARSSPAVEGLPAGTAERDLLVATALVVLGLSMYVVYARIVGSSALLDREDYALKYLLSRGLGPLQLGLPMAIAGCLWAEAAPLPRSRKLPFVAVALGIFVWSIAFISVRTNAVVLVLGYAAIACERRGSELRRVRIPLVALFLVAYFALESFALFRGVHKGDLAESVWILRNQGERALASAVGGSELAHPFVTAGEVLRAREPGELAGRSLVDGLLACLPRGLWPERPPLLAEQFARSNYAELAARGGGTAFSLVAEGWLDFGSLVGPLLFGLALGALLAWVEQRRRLVPHGVAARLTPYFVFYVALQHRNESGTLFKQVLMLSLVVLPIWLIADAATSAVKRRATLAPLQR